MKPRLKPPSSCSYSYSYSYSVLKRNQSAQKRSALMPEHASSPSFLDLLLRKAGVIVPRVRVRVRARAARIAVPRVR